jgi:ABC-2 type transport system permease protein
VINAIRSEWIKLRSTTATVLFACFAVAVPLIFTILISIFRKNPALNDSSELFANTVLGPCYLTGFFAGVVGALGIGQEYRHNTIRVTFTAEPRRSRVLTAKLIVNTLFGLAIGLVALLSCFAVASIILKSRHAHISLTDPGSNLTRFFGQIVFCGLFALAGFGLCAAVRQPAAAIPIMLVWALIVESIIGGIITAITGSGRAARYLPFREGFALAAGGHDTAEDMFSRVGAGAYFGVFVAILLAIGWVLTLRRDA